MKSARWAVVPFGAVAVKALLEAFGSAATSLLSPGGCRVPFRVEAAPGFVSVVGCAAPLGCLPPLCVTHAQE